MTPAKPRILVGQIFHEGNSFNARLTGAVDFTRYEGAAMIAECAGTGTTLGGILDTLIASGAEIVPTIAASASPGGPVEQAYWEALKGATLDAARGATFDAIVLDLHGAMIAERSDDPEGELLLALRAITGPDVPIAVGLDLHGHITDDMCAAADILVACKNNPHDDYHAAGARAARLCLDMLAGRITPVLTRIRLPMILFGNDETSSGPLKDLNAAAGAFEAAGVLDVSIFTVQAMLDVPQMGQVVTVLTDAAPDAGAEACRTIAEGLRARAGEFKTDHLPLDQLWPLIETDGTILPLAVSDFGDRVLAGAAGDSTEILRAAIAQPRYRSGDDRPIRAAIPVTDPKAALALQGRAIGEEVSVSLGGAFARTAPCDLHGSVMRHHAGRFTLAGPWLAGARADHGATTVLRVGAIAVIVTERPAYSQDVRFFTDLGLDIAAMDFAVCKSGFHFKLSFAGVATPLVVDTNGAGRYDPGRRGLTRAPIWPEVPDLPSLTPARHFRRGGWQ